MKAAAVAAVPLSSGHSGVSDWNGFELCTLLEVLLFFVFVMENFGLGYRTDTQLQTVITATLM
jgi:hypothetical protein